MTAWARRLVVYFLSSSVTWWTFYIHEQHKTCICFFFLLVLLPRDWFLPITRATSVTCERRSAWRGDNDLTGVRFGHLISRSLQQLFHDSISNEFFTLLLDFFCYYSVNTAVIWAPLLCLHTYLCNDSLNSWNCIVSHEKSLMSDELEWMRKEIMVA
jgi:hypothetical protein